jgi:hypothetical protein
MAIDKAVDSAVLDAKLTIVADKLREKTGTTETVSLEEMPEKVEEVFDAGVKSEYDRFWDAFQMNGTRRNYPYTFGGSGWTDEVFNPKYNIIVNSMATQTFGYNSQITKIPVPIIIDSPAYSTGVFVGCSRLIDIPSLTVTEKVTPYSSWFTGCTRLENIGLTPESVIASSIGFSDSPNLNVESLRRILNALADKTGISGTWTVTLGEANLAKLTAEEINIAEAKGWRVN